MKRSMAYVVGAVLAIGFAQGSAAADGERVRIDSQAQDDYAEVWARVHGSSSERHAQPAAARRVRWVRMYVPACRGNLPSARRNFGAVCDQAQQVCVSTAADDLGYWVYTAPASPPPTDADWVSTGQVVCRGGAVAVADPEPVLTVEDFRRLPIPAAGLGVQPADRYTLVNVPTNLYADAAPVVLPTRVLGFAVRVRATPVTFHWTYGDGRSLRTANAGGPYPRLDTAHTYVQPGRRTVSLETVYHGEYSVAGGPWLPIDGTATVGSPAVSLTVEEARAELVAGP